MPRTNVFSTIRSMVRRGCNFQDIKAQVFNIRPDYTNVDMHIDQVAVKWQMSEGLTDEQCLVFIMARSNRVGFWNATKITRIRSIVNGTYYNQTNMVAPVLPMVAPVLPVHPVNFQTMVDETETTVVTQVKAVAPVIREEETKIGARKYGVEIEFLRKNSVSHAIIARKLIAVGIACSCEGYNHRTRDHWKIVMDSSVTSNIPDYVGSNELVSPILKGQDGFDQLKKVCKVLNELGCKVNASCGIHVHHDLRRTEKPMTTFRNAFVTYQKYQSEISGILPRSRNDGYFCRQLGDLSNLNTDENSLQSRLGSIGRYHVVNFESYSRHRTIEFRQHAGSTNAKKIINWVIITQKIVNSSAVKAKTDVNPFNYSFSRKLHTEIGLKSDMKNWMIARKAQLANLAA